MTAGPLLLLLPRAPTPPSSSLPLQCLTLPVFPLDCVSVHLSVIGICCSTPLLAAPGGFLSPAPMAVPATAMTAGKRSVHAPSLLVSPVQSSLVQSDLLPLVPCHSLFHYPRSKADSPSLFSSSFLSIFTRSSYCLSYCRLFISSLSVLYLSSFTAGMCSNFPASFLIDYVRVYQAVGCAFLCSVLLWRNVLLLCGVLSFDVLYCFVL